MCREIKYSLWNPTIVQWTNYVYWMESNDVIYCHSDISTFSYLRGWIFLFLLFFWCFVPSKNRMKDVDGETPCRTGSWDLRHIPLMHPINLNTSHSKCWRNNKLRFNSPLFQAHRMVKKLLKIVFDFLPPRSLGDVRQTFSQFFFVFMFFFVIKNENFKSQT